MSGLADLQARQIIQRMRIVFVNEVELFARRTDSEIVVILDRRPRFVAGS